MLLLVLFRIALFVVFFLALLKIKKRRFRHFPARRTRISRRSGETTVWLERLVNAAIDMWFATLTHSLNDEHNKDTPGASSLAEAGVGGDPNKSSSGPEDDMTEAKFGSARGHDPSLVAAAITELLQPVLARLEERVKAGLEESGVADWAEFRIHSVGARPPRLRAIHIIQQNTATSNTTLSSGSGATSAAPTSQGPLSSKAAGAANTTEYNSAAALGSATDAAHVSTGNPLEASLRLPTTATMVAGERVGGTGGTSGSATSGAQSTSTSPSVGPTASFARTRRPGDDDAAPYSHMTPRPSPVAGGGVGDSAAESPTGEAADVSPTAHIAPSAAAGVAGGAAAASTPSSSPAVSSPTLLEFEAEIEYSGKLDVSLKADVSLGRGRLVPVYIRLQDVRLLRVHARVKLQLCFGPATMDSPRTPYLECTVWLESDPQFDMTLRTSLTRLNIQDFFLVPTLARFFLLRFVRAKLVRRNKAPGVTLRIPLPADIVDAGEAIWTAESTITDRFKDLK